MTESITITWPERFRIVALCSPSDSPFTRPERRGMWTASMHTAAGLQPYQWHSADGPTAQAAIDAAVAALDAKSQGGYTRGVAAVSLDLSALDDL
jgi:hypothetical protein